MNVKHIWSRKEERRQFNGSGESLRGITGKEETSRHFLCKLHSLQNFDPLMHTLSAHTFDSDSRVVFLQHRFSWRDITRKGCPLLSLSMQCLLNILFDVRVSVRVQGVFHASLHRDNLLCWGIYYSSHCHKSNHVLAYLSRLDEVWQ